VFPAAELSAICLQLLGRQAVAASPLALAFDPSLPLLHIAHGDAISSRTLLVLHLGGASLRSPLPLVSHTPLQGLSPPLLLPHARRLLLASKFGFHVRSSRILSLSIITSRGDLFYSLARPLIPIFLSLRTFGVPIAHALLVTICCPSLYPAVSLWRLQGGVGAAPLVGRLPQTPPAAFLAYQESDHKRASSAAAAKEAATGADAPLSDTGPVPLAAMASARAWASSVRSSPLTALYVGFRPGHFGHHHHNGRDAEDDAALKLGHFTLAEAPLERDLDAGSKGKHATVAVLPATPHELKEALVSSSRGSGHHTRPKASAKFLVPSRLLAAASGNAALVLYSELDRDFDLMRQWVDRGGVRKGFMHYIFVNVVISWFR